MRTSRSDSPQPTLALAACVAIAAACVSHESFVVLTLRAAQIAGATSSLMNVTEVMTNAFRRVAPAK